MRTPSRVLGFTAGTAANWRGSSGWSDRRVGLAPTGKAPPCHGARGKRTSRPMLLENLQVARHPCPAVKAQHLLFKLGRTVADHLHLRLLPVRPEVRKA